MCSHTAACPRIEPLRAKFVGVMPKMADDFLGLPPQNVPHRFNTQQRYGMSKKGESPLVSYPSNSMMRMGRSQVLNCMLVITRVTHSAALGYRASQFWTFSTLQVCAACCQLPAIASALGCTGKPGLVDKIDWAGLIS
jgi:hypothetical protein